MVIGGYAVGAHGFVRGTLDFDIWVNATRENAPRVWTALSAFGAPMDQVELSDFEIPGVAFQIGTAK